MALRNDEQKMVVPSFRKDALVLFLSIMDVKRHD